MPGWEKPQKLQGLLVGGNYYHDPLIHGLQFSAADAQELHQTLISSPYSLIAGRVDLLLGIDPNTNQTTRRNILVKLSEASRNASEEDILLFYFSGYSVLMNGDPYLCPSDVDLNYAEDTAIPLGRVREILEASNASSKFLLLNVYPLEIGANVNGIHHPKVYGDNARNIFRGVSGLAMIASWAPEEVSPEIGKKDHGIFAHYLLEALGNQKIVDQSNGIQINISEIISYMAARLSDYWHQRNVLSDGRDDLPVFSLAPRLSATNPVRRVFPSPVKDPEDFFGRIAELRRAQETLLNTSDILVFVHGERCIGKTSFLNRVKAMLDEESGEYSRFLHFSIEPFSVRTVGEFACELWNGLYGVCRNDIPSGISHDQCFSFQGYSQFCFGLQDLLRPFSSHRFVVFIDEFEKIKRVVDDVTVSQIIGLIRIIIEQTNLPIAFVISSLEDQKRFFPSSFGSPPSNLDVELVPFDRGDCDALLASIFTNNIEDRDELFGQIYLASGGHPHFVKLLATEVFDELRTTSLEKLLVVSTWQKLLTDGALIPEADNVFTFLYENFSDEERFVLLSLVVHPDYNISGQSLTQWRVSHRVAARQLEQRYYLIPLADGGYRLRLVLLGEWVKGWQSFALEKERLGLTITSIPAINEKGICIDEESGEIRVDGEVIQTQLSDLQDQALRFLVRNAGRVVSRKELYKYLHSKDETYLPTDQSLDALIYRLRLALGDKDQRYLKTVRKRGYLLTLGMIISRT